MKKNLPLLLAMLVVGNSLLTVSRITQLPELMHWILIIIALVLNMYSAIGLIVYVRIQKSNKN